MLPLTHIQAESVLSKSMELAEKDPHGLIITIVSISVVFISLALLFVLYFLFGRLINIIFKVAEDMELDIIDLKDLQAMLGYVGEHSKDYTIKYGNVSKQSVGAIQRRLLELEHEGGELFFGMPALSSVSTRPYFSTI